MKKRLLISALLFAAHAQAAPTPAGGELSEAGPLMFGGGPLVVPNPTSDVENLADGPLVCEPMLMNCDEFALTVNISDEFRKDEANKKEGVQFALNFTAADAALDAQADFEIYLFDAAGSIVAKSVSGAGIPESFRMPLSMLKNGEYVVTIIPYQPLGGSYTVDIQLDKDRKKSATVAKQGSSLLAGAFAPFAGLMLLAGWGCKRRRAA